MKSKWENLRKIVVMYCTQRGVKIQRMLRLRKVPAYRYLQAFKKMATEAGLQSHKVHYVCDLCIKKTEQKKEFSRFLPTPKMENDSVAEVPKFHSVSNPSFPYFDSQ